MANSAARLAANENEANWNAARDLAARAVETNDLNRPVLPVLNKNLSRRSHYIEKKIVPSPYIKIAPSKPNPFSANLQINTTHKGTVYGTEPGNILNRFKYQKGLFAAELEQKQYNLRKMNLADANLDAALQQQIKDANSLRQVHEREIDEAIQRAKNSAELSLARKQNASAKRRQMEIEKMKRAANMFPAPPKKPVAPVAPAPPVQKSFWQRMTGRGGSRKNRNRKTRRNRSTRRN